MTLSERILEKIERNHRGKENSIKRVELLMFCQLYEPGINDRKMRDLYSQLPVCTCQEGIFWPIRPSELLEFNQYLKNKAIPMFERWKMVSEEHSSLLPSNENQEWEQLELY